MYFDMNHQNQQLFQSKTDKISILIVNSCKLTIFILRWPKKSYEKYMGCEILRDSM